MGNREEKRLPSPDVLMETDLLIYLDLFQPLSPYMFPSCTAIDGIDVQIIEAVCQGVETGGKVTIACATLLGVEESVNRGIEGLGEENAPHPRLFGSPALRFLGSSTPRFPTTPPIAHETPTPPS